MSKEVYLDLVKREAEARTKIEEMARVQAALFTMNDWMRVRTEALDRHNALLMETYMGIKREVPHTRPVEEISKQAQELGGAQVFEDLGDEGARALGIDWDKDGNLLYKR